MLKLQGPGPDRDPDRPVKRKFSTTLSPEISIYRETLRFLLTTYIRTDGSGTKIRSILHIYILRGVRSRFQASGPGGSMIQP